MSTRIAVVGAGPGGYVAAFHAADLGMQVTLIDADANPGGVCTFRGCIPSKALLHAARVLDEAKYATAYGVSFGKLSIDVDTLRAREGQVVKKQTGGLGLGEVAQGCSTRGVRWRRSAWDVEQHSQA